MVDRNLDGVYFCIKTDDGKFVNKCFSDLTTEQRYEVMENRDIAWLKGLCNILGETIHIIGDKFDAYASIEEQ